MLVQKLDLIRRQTILFQARLQRKLSSVTFITKLFISLYNFKIEILACRETFVHRDRAASFRVGREGGGGGGN